jgi:hypothetical protein
LRQSFGRITRRLQRPIAVDKKYQGNRQPFEVGASVEFPNGIGKRLRYAGGIAVTKNAKFGNPFQTGLTVAAALTGHIYLAGAVTTKLMLPDQCAEDIPEMQPEMETLWKLGDELPT